MQRLIDAGKLLDANKVQLVNAKDVVFILLALYTTKKLRKDRAGMGAIGDAIQELKDLPTMTAVPVEWLREKMREPQMTTGNPFGFVLAEWLDEQEARK